MKVSLEDLKSCPQQRMGIDFKEELSGLEAVKPVVGRLSVSLDAWGARLAGQVKTLLKLCCDSCLRYYFQSLTVDIDERFVFAAQEQVARERELGHGDFVEAIPKDGALDISDIVYQAVTLATPTYKRCGEDCPGPPLPACAGDKQDREPDREESGRIDPRWQNLKTLFPNKNDE